MGSQRTNSTITKRPMAKLKSLYSLPFINIIKYGKNNTRFGVSIVKEKLMIWPVRIPIKHGALLWIPTLGFIEFFHQVSSLFSALKIDQVDTCYFAFSWQMVVKRGG